MKSASHRADILNRKATFVGVEVIFCSGDRTYGTVNFAIAG
jgi:uncharacterized protein YkwD